MGMLKGEVIVLIAVAAGLRIDAFLAARYIFDEFKFGYQSGSRRLQRQGRMETGEIE